MNYEERRGKCKLIFLHIQLGDPPLTTCPRQLSSFACIGMSPNLQLYIILLKVLFPFAPTSPFFGYWFLSSSA